MSEIRAAFVQTSLFSPLHPVHNRYQRLVSFQPCFVDQCIKIISPIYNLCLFSVVTDFHEGSFKGENYRRPFLARTSRPNQSDISHRQFLDFFAPQNGFGIKMYVTTTHSQLSKLKRNELPEFCAKKETIQNNQCHVIDSVHCRPELSTEIVGQFRTFQAHETALGKNAEDKKPERHNPN